jgi:cell division protein FtsB
LKFLQLIPSWLKSKYFLTAVAFATWMIFFDRMDIPTQVKRINELKKLQQSEKNYSNLINATREELKLLKTNPSTLEKYAREKYMMKKDNEDLFIVTVQKP